MLHFRASLPKLYQLVNVLYFHGHLSLVRSSPAWHLGFLVDGGRLLNVDSRVNVVVDQTARVLQRGTALRLRGTPLSRGHATDNTIICARCSQDAVMVNYDGGSTSCLALAYGLRFLNGCTRLELDLIACKLQIHYYLNLND